MFSIEFWFRFLFCAVFFFFLCILSGSSGLFKLDRFGLSSTFSYVFFFSFDFWLSFVSYGREESVIYYRICQRRFRNESLLFRFYSFPSDYCTAIAFFVVIDRIQVEKADKIHTMSNHCLVPPAFSKQIRQICLELSSVQQWIVWKYFRRSLCVTLLLLRWLLLFGKCCFLHRSTFSIYIFIANFMVSLLVLNWKYQIINQSRH